MAGCGFHEKKKYSKVYFFFRENTIYCHLPEEIESSSYGDSYLDEDEFGDVDNTSNTSGSCSLFPNAGLEPELLTMLESSSSPNEVIFRFKHARFSLQKTWIFLNMPEIMSPLLSILYVYFAKAAKAKNQLIFFATISLA